MTVLGTQPDVFAPLAAVMILAMVMHARQWQPKLGDWRERVTGLDELEQSLHTLLATPLGSVPGRPTFGVGLAQYIDSPIADVQVFVPREIVRAVKVWEPRIEVLGTTVEAGADGHFVASVRWKPTAASGLIETGEQISEARV